MVFASIEFDFQQNILPKNPPIEVMHGVINYIDVQFY